MRKNLSRDGIWTKGSRVRSANATSVLCRSLKLVFLVSEWVRKLKRAGKEGNNEGCGMSIWRWRVGKPAGKSCWASSRGCDKPLDSRSLVCWWARYNLFYFSFKQSLILTSGSPSGCEHKFGILRFGDKTYASKCNIFFIGRWRLLIYL